MFGLTRDFQQNGGTYMVLGGMQGIHSRDISMVQAGMITASKIPNFLPLRIKELDLYVTLQYDISDKKMLSHMLKSNKISMNEYYHLLLQTAVLLENSKLYMLNAERYILHEDYIFIEGTLQSGKLYFTYVPVESLVYDQSLSNLLKELITRMMASVSELRGAGVQKLLQFVSGDTFSVTGFKDLILGLLTLTEDSEEPNKASREPIIENNSIDVSKQQYTRKSFRDEIQHTDHQDKLNSKSNKLQENHRLKQHQHDRGEGIIQQKLVPDRESSSVWGQDLFSNGAYQISGTDPDDDEAKSPLKVRSISYLVVYSLRLLFGD
ncbi:DUF6382 domain-containing protein [Paenibacillus pini]|uniref:DUF6382 domain-containing protein n=1 Tax=Paenibacillus pini JCM 16418 TaxID=1236976 RepID=W7YKK2_9BACL|nr:DUF6382 domain-containing protein [Paenibacillus pini]GAF08213.1 hypothetical protein JCM16418_2254 [Paenibacillus pini JCM 16418]